MNLYPLDTGQNTRQRTYLILHCCHVLNKRGAQKDIFELNLHPLEIGQNTRQGTCSIPHLICMVIMYVSPQNYLDSNFASSFVVVLRQYFLFSYLYCNRQTEPVLSISILKHQPAQNARLARIICKTRANSSDMQVYISIAQVLVLLLFHFSLNP